MAFQIIEEQDQMIVESVNVLIYGQPGIGKTSIAQTADDVVLLDFDNGVHRSIRGGAAIKMSSWQEANDFMNDSFIKDRGIKTIIIDTAGTMLDDFMADHVIKADGKNGKNGGGLTLQGYGALKQQFNSFMSQLRMLGIDVIFICHDSKETSGNETTFIPKVTGGSYDILLAKCDMVGYMESRNDKRTIDFNPTDHHRGKNTAAFPRMNVPDASTPDFNNFMSELIKGVKTKIATMSDQQKESLKVLNEQREKLNSIDNVEDLLMYQDLIQELHPTLKVQLIKAFDVHFVNIWKSHIASISSVDSAMEAVDEIKSISGNAFKHVQSIRSIFSERIKELGYEWNDKQKKYQEPVSVDEGEKNGSGESTEANENESSIKQKSLEM